MVVSYFHTYFINFLSLLVSIAAITILTASGIKNGVTHQPRMVASEAGSFALLYTTANQAVPNA